MTLNVHKFITGPDPHPVHRDAPFGRVTLNVHKFITGPDPHPVHRGAPFGRVTINVREHVNASLRSALTETLRKNELG